MNKQSYAQKLKDPRWQKKRLQIMERDNWSCRSCHTDKATLHVHHKYYAFGREPWDYHDDILITLCDRCHEAEEAFKDSIYDMPRVLLCAGFDNSQLQQTTAFLNGLTGKLLPADIIDVLARMVISEEFFQDVQNAMAKEKERIIEKETSNTEHPF